MGKLLRGQESLPSHGMHSGVGRKGCSGRGAVTHTELPRTAWLFWPISRWVRPAQISLMGSKRHCGSMTDDHTGTRTFPGIIPEHRTPGNKKKATLEEWGDNPDQTEFIRIDQLPSPRENGTVSSVIKKIIMKLHFCSLSLSLWPVRFFQL